MVRKDDEGPLCPSLSVDEDTKGRRWRRKKGRRWRGVEGLVKVWETDRFKVGKESRVRSTWK